MKSLKISCSKKQVLQYNTLKNEYLHLSLLFVDANLLGDKHVAEMLANAINYKAQEVGRFILDHDVGGIV